MLYRSCTVLIFVINLSIFCDAAPLQDTGPSEAIRSIQQVADRGIPSAQFHLGMAYRDGRGVQQNSAEAAKWFRKAAEQGYARAQLELGKLYEEGLGVTKDYAEAMKWYRKAAEQSLAQTPDSTGSMGTGPGSGGGLGSGYGSSSGIITTPGTELAPGSGGGIGSGRGPYVVGNGVTPPTVLLQPLPSYTEAARNARVSGSVVIQCVIRKDGTVDSFKVIRGLGYGLEESAINTIATRWRFNPGTKDGVPVDVLANIAVEFRLPR